MESSLRGSEATKQSRVSGCSLRLDCFAAARNDVVRRASAVLTFNAKLLRG
jgi:hypothetical protein